MNYRNLSLPQIYEEAEAIADDAKAHFGQLNHQQLNWKPAADSWSVAQCLDHLISTNGDYNHVFDLILKGEYRRTLLQRLPLLPSFYSRVLINAMSPDGKRKFKAPGSLQPSSSSIDPDIVDRFVMNHRETLARIKLLEYKGPAEIIIASPFLAGVTLRLLDAFRLILTHERRHFAQAVRVMAMAQFPG